VVVLCQLFDPDPICTVRNKIQSPSSIDLLLGVGAGARSASDAGWEVTLKAESNELSYNKRYEDSKEKPYLHGVDGGPQV